MTFVNDTYIVLDVPPSRWTEQILAVRLRHDAWRAALPVEITITGSAGVGTLAGQQSQEVAFRAIDTLAAQAAPVRTAFRSIKRFRGGGVFYFAPEDARPFVRPQERIVGTGLKFKPVSLPYVPHCTIGNLGADPPGEAVEEVCCLRPLEDVVTLEDLSVYAVNGSGCHLLHRAKLRSKEVV